MAPATPAPAVKRRPLERPLHFFSTSSSNPLSTQATNVETHQVFDNFPQSREATSAQRSLEALILLAMCVMFRCKGEAFTPSSIPLVYQSPAESNAFFPAEDGTL
ncbi:hypothetical protein U9M48_036886 [Paspalum notatum var. saurae]|uniref:Uncharacterized protein n=1 Tax=Paspalum notatum var. saurae TaxID=547442 RepID=A0AAQ3UEV1_PASNO